LVCLAHFQVAICVKNSMQRDFLGFCTNYEELFCYKPGQRHRKFAAIAFRRLPHVSNARVPLHLPSHPESSKERVKPGSAVIAPSVWLRSLPDPRQPPVDTDTPNTTTSPTPPGPIVAECTRCRRAVARIRHIQLLRRRTPRNILSRLGLPAYSRLHG
jgi:hypothetical protein